MCWIIGQTAVVAVSTVLGSFITIVILALVVSRR